MKNIFILFSIILFFNQALSAVSVKEIESVNSDTNATKVSDKHIKSNPVKSDKGP